ncbi:MAG: peptidylprolyl isomerase [Clostridia bacterium]|nr:peptidylprolyl isomerase [Clostridia bacterium]
MKKTIRMILCLTLVFTLMVGCTVVNVAKAGTVNGEDVPLGVYKYSVRIAEMYLGVMDAEDMLTMIAMYDSYTASMVYGAISDIMAEAGAPEEGESIWDKAYGETTVGEAVKEAVFDELAKLYVAADIATEKELTLTEEEASALSTAKANLYSVPGSKAAFDEALGKINLTSNQLEDLWTKILLADKLSGNIAEEGEIAPEEVEAYFNDNYMRVKHILVKVGDEGIETIEDAKKKADEILGALASDGDFEGLMTAYSSDVDAEGNINGGEEGYIFKEGDFGNPAFEDASKALAVGEYTKEAVLVTGGSYEGYHIIKRYEMPENYFADNAENLTSMIESTLKADAYEAYINAETEKAEIVKNESKIKGVKLTVIK